MLLAGLKQMLQDGGGGDREASPTWFAPLASVCGSPMMGYANPPSENLSIEY